MGVPTWSGAKSQTQELVLLPPQVEERGMVGFLIDRQDSVLATGRFQELMARADVKVVNPADGPEVRLLVEDGFVAGG